MAPQPFLGRLRFPLPVRSTLPPLDQYAKLEHNGARRVAGYVEASRGCLHLCTHCPIPPVYGGRFFIVPREVVLEDVRAQVAGGATHITFGDPDFLNGPGHALKLIRDLHAEFPHLTYDFTAKVQHILERSDLFPELGASGCVFMISAVESLSERILTILDKHHTRADVQEALKIVRDAGITFRPTWVPFTALDDPRRLSGDPGIRRGEWVDRPRRSGAVLHPAARPTEFVPGGTRRHATAPGRAESGSVQLPLGTPRS